MKILGISGYTAEKKNMINSAYVDAFTMEGVTPLLLPVFKLGTNEVFDKKQKEDLKERAEAIIERIDGLVLSGGGDINPLSFDQDNYASWSCNIFRDKMELALLKAAIKVKMPIMGICRGFQLIGNHFELMGFHQSLSSDRNFHNASDLRITNRSEPVHEVMAEGSYAEFLKENGVDDIFLPVNSWHHQGFAFNEKLKEAKEADISKYYEEAKETKGLEIVAATTSIIEAFQHTKLPIFAVQWHPEEYGNKSLTLKYFVDKFLMKGAEAKNEETEEQREAIIS